MRMFMVKNVFVGRLPSLFGGSSVPITSTARDDSKRLCWLGPTLGRERYCEAGRLEQLLGAELQPRHSVRS